MLKNGEIRLLRDSLKGAQQEKEAQRQTQTLLDMQRCKEQSHKEKELNKKVSSNKPHKRTTAVGLGGQWPHICVQVQALQTELQFKEAEINDMKAKLHSSDRKKMASLLPRHRSVTMVAIFPVPDVLTWTLRKSVSAAQSRRLLAWASSLSWHTL